VHSYRYPDRDTDFNIEQQPESLDTRRLVVLTTDETCSASEVIIAGLRPYLPVYTVGGTTCGKPYLMYALTFGNYELSPVGIHVYTSQGEATYTNGIKADVKTADDLTHELGDPQERMLKAALQVLKSGATRY
jgi:C-terminal processing protease CtpA/Prc